MINHSIIKFKDLEFLISGSPYEENIYEFIDLLKFHNIKHVIRVCVENTYPKYMLIDNGFFFYEFKIIDGNITTVEEKKIWINLYNNLKKNGIKNFAIHCVSGFGRAPLFLAIALVNDGLEPYEAISFIRNHRKGSLNSLQVKYIINQKKNIQNCICNLQ